MIPHQVTTTAVIAPPGAPDRAPVPSLDQSLNAKLCDATGARLLSRAEFCIMCNISTSTAERWDRMGYGPRPIKIGPRRVGYRAGELAAFIEGRRTVAA